MTITIPYDSFIGAFLAKITEYDLLQLDDDERDEVVDGYVVRALADTTLRKVLNYNYAFPSDDESSDYDEPSDGSKRDFVIETSENVSDEIIDIVSDGMIIQWLKPYVYKQELLENVLNTRDYSMYSPSELLLRIGNAFAKAQKDYKQELREYSYNHGNLKVLHI